jgi:hypothetical protein
MLANLLTEHWQSTIDLEIVETLESVDDEESPAALKPSPASTQPKASEAIAQTAPAPAPAFPASPSSSRRTIPSTESSSTCC